MRKLDAFAAYTVCVTIGFMGRRSKAAMSESDMLGVWRKNRRQNMGKGSLPGAYVFKAEANHRRSLRKYITTLASSWLCMCSWQTLLALWTLYAGKNVGESDALGWSKPRKVYKAFNVATGSAVNASRLTNANLSGRRNMVISRPSALEKCGEAELNRVHISQF